MVGVFDTIFTVGGPIWYPVEIGQRGIDETNLNKNTGTILLLSFIKFFTNWCHSER